MNTTELIEIAKGCGGRYAYTNWGYHPFSLTELQQFAQRIEQPLQHKINELRFDVEYQQRQVEELEKHVEQLREALQVADKALLRVFEYAVVDRETDDAIYDARVAVKEALEGK